MVNLLLMSLFKELINLEMKLDVLGNTNANMEHELEQLVNRKDVVLEEVAQVQVLEAKMSQANKHIKRQLVNDS